jgi:hypothetical protein
MIARSNNPSSSSSRSSERCCACIRRRIRRGSWLIGRATANLSAGFSTIETSSNVQRLTCNIDAGSCQYWRHSFSSKAHSRPLRSTTVMSSDRVKLPTLTPRAPHRFRAVRSGAAIKRAIRATIAARLLLAFASSFATVSVSPARLAFHGSTSLHHVPPGVTDP